MLRTPPNTRKTLRASLVKGSCRLSQFIQANAEAIIPGSGSLRSSFTSSTSSSSSGYSAANTCESTDGSPCAVSLSLVELQNFVHKTLPLYVKNKDILTLLRQEVAHMNGEEVIFGLTTILNYPQTIPSKVIGEIHSFMGQIYLSQKNNSAAVTSFLKALWIQKTLLLASTDGKRTDRLVVAKSEHRLGLAYGRKGEYANAICLLQRALTEYHQAGVRIYDCCRTSAEEALAHYKEAELLKKLPRELITCRRALPKRHLSY